MGELGVLDYSKYLTREEGKRYQRENDDNMEQDIPERIKQMWLWNEK